MLKDHTTHPWRFLFMTHSELFPARISDRSHGGCKPFNHRNQRRSRWTPKAREISPPRTNGGLRGGELRPVRLATGADLWRLTNWIKSCGPASAVDSRPDWIQEPDSSTVMGMAHPSARDPGGGKWIGYPEEGRR